MKGKCEDGMTNITASFDGGWQCRGSSKSYNSRSGHAALIGAETGKVLNFSTRIKIAVNVMPILGIKQKQIMTAD